MYIEHILNNGVGNSINKITNFKHEEGKYKGNKLISKVINYEIESGDKVIINIADSEDVNVIYNNSNNVTEIQIFKKLN